jgi:hypothetical protein
VRVEARSGDHLLQNRAHRLVRRRDTLDGVACPADVPQDDAAEAAEVRRLEESWAAFMGVKEGKAKEDADNSK